MPLSSTTELQALRAKLCAQAVSHATKTEQILNEREVDEAAEKKFKVEEDVKPSMKQRTAAACGAGWRAGAAGPAG